MDTTGDSPASIAAHLILLVVFGFVAVRLLPGRPRPFPVVTVVAVLVIGIPSLLQFGVPSLGTTLERDPAATLGRGEWWRPLTALLAQDGGVVAAAFNLLVVASVVLVAEWTWGRWRTVVVFLGASVIVNLVALAWGARGGGSSFASDGLMLAVTTWGALGGRIVPLRIVAGLELAIAVALVILDDAHGLAMLVGAGLGAALAILGSARSATSGNPAHTADSTPGPERTAIMDVSPNGSEGKGDR